MSGAKRMTVLLLLLNCGAIYWLYSRHLDHLTERQLTRPARSFAGPGLQLLKELPALPQLKNPPAELAAPADYVERYEHVEAADDCLHIGPFETTEKRDALRQWLRNYVAALNSRVVPERGRQLFWVYLEPGSDEATAENLGRLQSGGVEDYMVVRRGNLRNAISLGLFSSQDSVNRRLAELSQKGYSPVVVPRYETVSKYWLTARMAAGNEQGLQIPEELLANARTQTIACDAIAED